MLFFFFLFLFFFFFFFFFFILFIIIIFFFFLFFIIIFILFYYIFAKLHVSLSNFHFYYDTSAQIKAQIANAFSYVGEMFSVYCML